MKEKFSFPTPTDSFFYKKGKLTIDGVSLEDLIEQFGSPLYVYSGKSIRTSYSRLKTALKGLPVHIHYAVKANSNLHVLKLFQTLGSGCDLVSYGEWYRAQKAGFPPEKRVLSGVAKNAKELESILRHTQGGVYSIHVESVMEFDLIRVLANALKREVRVALRYNPDVEAKTLDKISTGRKQDKFGLTQEEILDLVNFHHQDKHIKISGLSMHIGSQITSLKPFDQAFKKLRNLSEIVEQNLHKKLDYVDLGGGIGIQYSNEKTIDLSLYAQIIQKHFKGFKKILVEPGRGMVANAGALVSQVVFSKDRSGNRTLILDSGMNDLVRPALYDAYHEILPLVQSSNPLIAWDVVGGICESTDYFARARKLPLQGLPGESLAILSSGAYGFSMCSNYNSRPKLAEVMVDQGKTTLIRKRETLKDLVRGEA